MVDSNSISRYLAQAVGSLPQIGDVTGEKLKKLGIFTVNDLLTYFPFRYDDLSHIVKIAQAKSGELVTLQGSFQSLQNVHLRGGKTIQKGVFQDDTGTIAVSWFNQPFLLKSLTPLIPISLSGKVIFYRGRLSLTSPQYELIHHPSIHTGRLVPIYHETAGLSSKWLRFRLSTLLKTLSNYPEWLPPELLQSYHLISKEQAIRHIHFPPDSSHLEAAKDRLKFDEMLLIQLKALVKKRQLRQTKGYTYSFTPHDRDVFIKALPFTLTASQMQALVDLENDLKSGHPMNRLLQGDVGSGKTVVAAYALYLSAINQKPAVLMVPTEILANQHYQTLSPILKRLHLELAFHTQNRTLLPPTALIHLGTQALLHRQIPPNLGLIIVDEQHKFGVNQRLALAEGQSTWPHLMIMTATPIPRTLSLTLYADLSLSNLTHKPYVTKIKTKVVYANNRPQAYEFIGQRISHFHEQAYVVCPFIADSVNQDLATVKAAETVYQDLCKNVFPHLKIGLLHGRQNAKQKQQTLNAFADHHLDILVTTPLVEVGVDIPQASIMWIESGERFGLASLHQLRGRVGRHGQIAFCFIFASVNLSENSQTRLKAIETHDSGFDLAETDLKLRGPGNWYGTAQSGFINLKLASLYDLDLIRQTQEAAAVILTQYPHILPLSQKPEILVE